MLARFVAAQTLGRVETQQRIAIEQFRAGSHERCRITRFRVALSRIVDQVEPGDRHRDVKLLRHAFRGRESTKSFEQPALGFLSAMAREIDDRQTDMICMRERLKRRRLEPLNQLVISAHLYSLACRDPGSGAGDVRSSGPETPVFLPRLLLQRVRGRPGRGFGALPIGETLSPRFLSKRQG